MGIVRLAVPQHRAPAFRVNLRLADFTGVGSELEAPFRAASRGLNPFASVPTTVVRAAQQFNADYASAQKFVKFKLLRGVTAGGGKPGTPSFIAGASLGIMPEGGVVAEGSARWADLGAEQIGERSPWVVNGAEDLGAAAPRAGKLAVEDLAPSAPRASDAAAQQLADAKSGVKLAGVNAGRTWATWVGKGAAIGAGVGVAGYGVGVGLYYAGSGLASGVNALLGGGGLGAFGQQGGGGGGGTTGSSGSSGTSDLGGILGSPLVVLLLIGGVLFIGYEASKHSGSSGSSSSAS